MCVENKLMWCWPKFVRYFAWWPSGQIVLFSFPCACSSISAALALSRWSDLTYWGRVTHICVGKLTPLVSRQTIIWTSAVILLIGPLGTFKPDSNIFVQENVFGNVVCQMASILSRSKCVKKLELTHHFNGSCLNGTYHPGIHIGIKMCISPQLLPWRSRLRWCK